MTHQNKKLLTAVKIAGFTAAAAVLLLGTGCQTDKSSVTDFFPEDEGRSTQNFMTAQAAAGARADATLQPMHFDGAKLNSLGEGKLDLMLKDDDSADAMVVYMNLDGNDPDLKSRRDAVMNYLEDRGVAQEHIEFKSGTNPNVTSMAVTHIAAMSKTESGGEDSGKSSGATAPMSPSQSK